jgi:hypothetical protein
MTEAMQQDRGVYGRVEDLLRDALADLAVGNIPDAITRAESATVIMQEAQAIRKLALLARVAPAASRATVDTQTGGEG